MLFYHSERLALAFGILSTSNVISLVAGATQEDGEIIAKLFGAVGKIWKADEKLFDAVTGLSHVSRMTSANNDDGFMGSSPHHILQMQQDDRQLGRLTEAVSTELQPVPAKNATRPRLLLSTPAAVTRLLLSQGCFGQKNKPQGCCCLVFL
ncbi:hypothetical protein L1987_05560 [Smallanthus sonchifolius]|uniref:Uncharacterized protein n=1 Tax=Smallanthus sonchifolius TaxID=185202 RepID=A0ACB9JVQ8_9ASTR|nr:hypothetical protein L1987_05560 [Smallanthus sonchifolius]